MRNIGKENNEYAVLRLSTFIPLESVSIPRVGTFAGDNRGFNVNSISVRTQQYIVVDLDKSKSTTVNYIGETHQVDSVTGDVIKRGRDTNSGLNVVTYAQDGKVFLNAMLSSKNPIANPLGPFNAPPIDYDIWINVNDNRIAGVANTFPAYEMYISQNGNKYEVLHQYMPRDPSAWYAPLGLFDTSTQIIDNTSK